MAGAMQEIRNSHGGRSPGGLQAGEPCGVVNHIVRDKLFLAAARQHVSRRCVIQYANCGDSGKEQSIASIEEPVG